MSNKASAFSDANWVSLGSGMNNTVDALAADEYGNVYAGGLFTTAGGITANHIAKWNGRSWSALGSGMNNGVNALVCDNHGNLYAGGFFTNAGGTPASDIAEWNGSAWSPLGSGMNSTVLSLALDKSGNLYAGGYFTTAGGSSANCVAKWTGTNWAALSSGMSQSSFPFSPSVNALLCDSLGNVYAGGSFSSAGGGAARNIAEWTGTTWFGVGMGINGLPEDTFVEALAFDNSGTLYAGGLFEGGAPPNILEWGPPSFSWTFPGSNLNGIVNSLTSDSSRNIYAGGQFTTAGGINASCIAKWNGTNWFALGSGVNSNVFCMAFDNYGNLYAGGLFTTAGTNVAYNVAEALLGESSQILSLSKPGGGTNVIIAQGTPGNSYALDLATNLAAPVNWMPQVTNSSPNASFIFTNVSGRPQSFYRTRYVP